MASSWKKRIIKLLMLALLPLCSAAQEHFSGQVEVERKVNDSLTRVEIFDRGGKNRQGEGIRKYGVQDSVWTWYHAKNKVRSRYYYNKGKLDSALKYWTKGELISREHFFDPPVKGVYYFHVQWHTNGDLYRLRKNGVLTEFNSKGKRVMQGFFKGALEDSIWTYWDNDGNLSRIENWKDGKKEGEARGWHPGGKQLAWLKIYKNNEPVGEETGWDTKGNIISKIVHARTAGGKTREEIRYNDKGEVTSRYSRKELGKDSLLEVNINYSSHLPDIAYSIHKGLKIKNEWATTEQKVVRKDSTLHEHYLYDRSINNFPRDIPPPPAEPGNFYGSPFANMAFHYTWYKDGKPKEIFVREDNDSVYYRYKMLDAAGNMLREAIVYNPEKNYIIRAWSSPGKLSSYTYRDKDKRYVSKLFYYDGKLQTETSGKIREEKDELTGLDKRRDYFLKKTFFDNGKPDEILDRSQKNKTRFERYDTSGVLIYRRDTLKKVTTEKAVTRVEIKEWDLQGNLLRKKTDEKYMPLNLSGFRISEATEGWDSVRTIITGNVMDADNKHFLNGCSVVLRNEERTSSAVTNEEGYFSIEGVPEGKYVIVISMAGYSPVIKQVKVEGKQYIKTITTLKRLPADREEYDYYYRYPYD